jgi:hypothetical protein
MGEDDEMMGGSVLGATTGINPMRWCAFPVGGDMEREVL